MTKLRYTSGPPAGTSKPAGIFSTRSGVPRCQPSGNAGRAGIFAESPLAMPVDTQRPIVAISSSVNRRSPAKSPKPCAACQGGM